MSTVDPYIGSHLLADAGGLPLLFNGDADGLGGDGGTVAACHLDDGRTSTCRGIGLGGDGDIIIGGIFLEVATESVGGDVVAEVFVGRLDL